MTIKPAALKLKDAATYLGVSKMTMIRLVRFKKLRPCRILRHLLFRVQDLDLLLEEGINLPPKRELKPTDRRWHNPGRPPKKHTR